LDRCLERVVGLPVKDESSRYSAITDVLGHGYPGVDAEADMKWLGLLPSEATLEPGFYPPLPKIPLSPLDLLSLLLSHRLRYLPGEHDLVILGHEVIAEPSTATDLAPTVHSSRLVVHGDGHSSAMARTVGLPVAFATLRVLDGNIDVRGVTGPTHPSIYPTMLEDLARANLVFRETVSIGGGIGPALRLGWTGS